MCILKFPLIQNNMYYFHYSFCQHFLRVKKKKRQYKNILTEAELKAGIFTEVLLYPRTLDSQHLMIFIDVRRKGKEV